MPYLGQNSISDSFGFLVDRFGYNAMWQAASKNNRAYLLFMQRFMNYYMNRFEYEGIPDESKDVTFRNNNFERWLFFTTAVAIFEDKQLGVQVLPVSGWSGKRDIGGFPKSWEVNAGNGYHKELSHEDSVLMFNDRAFSIPFLHILYELSFMVDIDNTHRQNIRALRQPFILELTEDEKKSGEAFIRQFDGFDDVIKIRKRVVEKAVRQGATQDVMHAFNSGVTAMGDELNKDFVSFENRIFTYLGLNNVTFEKKERMLTGELSQNDQVIQSNFTNALECRRSALERANKLFGTSMSVKPATYVAPDTDMVNTQSQNFERGGEGDDSVPANGIIR